MDKEKILEIARRFDPDEPDFVMTEDTLIAFAQSVIEAERETRKLTDEEIGEIVREASSGSALRRDGSTSLRIARAIERRINREEE